MEMKCLSSRFPLLNLLWALYNVQQKEKVIKRIVTHRMLFYNMTWNFNIGNF